MPTEVLAALAEGSGRESFTPGTEGSRWQAEMSSFRNLPGWKDRLGLLKEHLFPPSHYMLQKYQAPNPVLLRWLYLKRIAQGMFKILR